ncbi:MAG: 30S ribosomal protein S13 [Candidatus Marsarchaeota archaeon]|jgi:small subunit ribosomal protein S13|nr:30S ribosomal protein S13 [Candidatus Marsarchaeota archaeon]
MADKDRKEREHKGARAETSIIRMAGRDINGSYNVTRGLMQIKGIGHNMAMAISKGYSEKYNVPSDTALGTLSDEQIAQLESLIKEPAGAGVPQYLLNRRRDPETGLDMHVAGTDLVVKTRQDVDLGIRTQTWIGSRHQYGQRVRGQRTRNTGRTGTTIGVMKKSVQQAAAAANAQEKGAGKAAKEGKPAAGAPAAAAPAGGASAAAPAAAPAKAPAKDKK